MESRSRLVAVAAGAFLSMGLLSLAHGAQESRIDWETESPSTVLDLVTPGGLASDRFVIHQGRLRSFAPADVRLFAIFLSDEREIERLRDRLREGGKRTGEGGLETILGGATLWDELRLEKNGTLTVVADEAVVPHTELLVVVNGSGEILGFRSLWEASRELAVLQ